MTRRLGEPGAIGMVVLDQSPVNVVPSPPAPRVWAVPDRPVDLDAIEAIVRLGRAGTFGPAELRMRLRQVIA